MASWVYNVILFGGIKPNAAKKILTVAILTDRILNFANSPLCKQVGYSSVDMSVI